MWYGMVWNPYHTIPLPKRYGTRILCSTSYNLSLYRQNANRLRYSLAILGLVCHVVRAQYHTSQMVWLYPPPKSHTNTIPRHQWDGGIHHGIYHIFPITRLRVEFDNFM